MEPINDNYLTVPRPVDPLPQQALLDLLDACAFPLVYPPSETLNGVRIYQSVARGNPLAVQCLFAVTGPYCLLASEMELALT